MINLSPDPISLLCSVVQFHRILRKCGLLYTHHCYYSTILFFTFPWLDNTM
jgi:hypothetical protein